MTGLLQCLAWCLKSEHQARTTLSSPGARAAIGAGKAYGLTDEEAACIYSYTLPDPSIGQSPFTAVNTALRFPGSIEASQMQAMVDLLGSALPKLRTYQGPLVRRTDLPSEVMKEAEDSQRFCDPAFLSFSKDPFIVLGNDMLVVKSVTGKDISEFSAFADELEVLYPAGTLFDVTSLVTSKAGVLYYSSKRFEHGESKQGSSGRRRVDGFCTPRNDSVNSLGSSGED